LQPRGDLLDTERKKEALAGQVSPLWIAAVGEVPEGTARPVLVRGRRFVLVHLADGVHASDPTCSLHGAPLDRTVIHENQALWPWHGVPLDTASGCGAAAQRAIVRSYPLRMMNGGV
jgi:nitrite reductase/ring-hydroxylating ferredoxin subunit